MLVTHEPPNSLNVPMTSSGGSSLLPMVMRQSSSDEAPSSPRLHKLRGDDAFYHRILHLFYTVRKEVSAALESVSSNGQVGGPSIRFQAQ